MLHRLIVLCVALGGCAHARGWSAADRAELLEMFRVDQGMQFDPAMNPVGDTDAHNERTEAAFRRQTRRLKALIDAHGWPRRAVVGAEGEKAAWVMVDHSDADVAFQRRVLTLLQRPENAAEVDKKAIATLIDRVLKNEGKKQRYGTQFKDGQLVPIEDEAYVDARRAQMGLEPLQESVEKLHAFERQMSEQYQRQQAGTASPTK
jgi:hypothetical protein